VSQVLSAVRRDTVNGDELQRNYDLHGQCLVQASALMRQMHESN
jgi:hypothetical protein